MDEIPADLDSETIGNLNCAALNLSTAVVEYITAALKHMSRGFACMYQLSEMLTVDRQSDVQSIERRFPIHRS